MDKDYYISKISAASNHYGDKLVEMMDKYNKQNLQQIKTAEAKEFWELCKRGGEVARK